MTWDNTITSLGGGDCFVSGAGSGVVDCGSLSYEQSDHTLVIPVTTAFDALQTLTIQALRFNVGTPASATDNLELVISEPTATVYMPVAYDDKTIRIGNAVQFTTTTSSGFEGVTSVNIEMLMTPSSGSPIDVTFSVGGTAADPADYTIAGSPITIPAGNTTWNIPITVVNDSTNEGDDTIVITMTAVGGTYSINTNNNQHIHTYTIINDDGFWLNCVGNYSVDSKNAGKLDLDDYDIIGDDSGEFRTSIKCNPQASGFPAGTKVEEVQLRAVVFDDPDPDGGYDFNVWSMENDPQLIVDNTLYADAADDTQYKAGLDDFDAPGEHFVVLGNLVTDPAVISFQNALINSQNWWATGLVSASSDFAELYSVTRGGPEAPYYRIGYSIDSIAPQLVSVTLVDGSTPSAGAGADDTIVITFSEDISAASIVQNLQGANVNNNLQGDGTGNITCVILNDCISEIGTFATPTQVTADASTLTVNGNVVTITLGGTVVDNVWPSGVFTANPTFTDIAGNTVDTSVTQVTGGNWGAQVEPTVEWTVASQASASESGFMYVFAQLSKTWTLPVTVPFTVSGTATIGDPDYDISPNSPYELTIISGDLNAMVTLTLNNDAAVEGDETVILDITVGGLVNATAGTILQHTATITDDEINISSAVTADSDNDGQIDQLTLTFSEQVDITDAGGAGDGFDAITLNGGYTIANGDYGINDTTALVLSITQSGTPDTSVVIDPTYDTAGSSTIMSEVPAEMNDGATVSGTDGARPVIVSASRDSIISGGNLLTGTIVTVIFSENIDTNSSVVGDFIVEPDGSDPPQSDTFDGATATISDPGGGSDTLTITLTGDTASGVWTDNDEIDINPAMAADHIEDVVGNDAAENLSLDDVPIVAPIAIQFTNTSSNGPESTTTVNLEISLNRISGGDAAA
jgi:hypothetical protein